MPSKLKPIKIQSDLYRTKARFPVVVAGRGSGKTEIARRYCIRSLSIHRPDVFEAGDVPRYFYALPTQAQASRVAWKQLKALLPKEWHEKSKAGRTFYESDKIIRTRFGTELHLVGMDAPQRIEGNQWCGGIIDESSDQKPGVFDRSIRPALTAFKGYCWRIGVPKRFGIGAEDFKSAYDIGLSGIDENIVSFSWPSSIVVDPEELETIKKTVDARDFKEQYEASWEQISGAIFHAFSEEENVTIAAEYDSTRPIVVGSDFNVDPMCWTLNHRERNKLITFDELMIRNTNTRETLNILYSKYGHHKAGFEFFGDASSKARKTSASESDYVQIKNDTRFEKKHVYYFDSNPAIADRFAACNALLCNANGERRWIINPRCKRLIGDLKHRSFKPGTKEAADSGDMGHMSDGAGYVVVRCFPLRVEVGTRQEVIIR